MVEEQNKAETPKRKRHRSPAYPGIDLKTAIDRANTFYANERRNAANIVVAAKHWGLSHKSGPGAITIAAMTAFGLMDSEGTGNGRTLKLSDLGIRILLDERPESSDRIAAIKKAALNPTIHQKLWEKWGQEVPSDENLRHALIFGWKFNEKVIDRFIAEYKSTIAFAGLTDSDIISDDDSDKGEVLEGTQSSPMREKNRWNPPSGTPNEILKGKSGMKTFHCTTENGELTIQWPETIGTDDQAMVEVWLETMKKKILGTIGKQENGDS